MRRASPFRPLATATILLSALAACTNGQNPNTAAHPAGGSLYDRLGGKPALSAVVDDFVANVGADPRIAARFANIADPNFKAEMVDELCATTGGPCQYTGPSMKDAHAALAITDAEFNAMTQDLRHSMERQGISVDNQVAFAEAMEPLRNDIVSPLPPTTTVVAIPAGRAYVGRPYGGHPYVGHTYVGRTGRYRHTVSRGSEPNGRTVEKKATTRHPVTTTTHHPATTTTHHPPATVRKKAPSKTSH